jgi:glycerol transport system substrate-binding protein
MFNTIKNILAVAVSISLITISNAVADGHGAAIKKWSNGEFSLSTISAKEREKELNWFHDAAKPFKGMEINVLSETIPTHEYESKVLTKAFEEITGIKVNHQLLGEGEVVQAVQTQMQTGRNLYDAYINDSDLIGTHSRLQVQMVIYINYLTNNLLTFIGLEKIGLTDLKSKKVSKLNTDTI